MVWAQVELTVTFPAWNGIKCITLVFLTLLNRNRSPCCCDAAGFQGQLIKRLISHIEMPRWWPSCDLFLIGSLAFLRRGRPSLCYENMAIQQFIVPQMRCAGTLLWDSTRWIIKRGKSHWHTLKIMGTWTLFIRDKNKPPSKLPKAHNYSNLNSNKLK